MPKTRYIRNPYRIDVPSAEDTGELHITQAFIVSDRRGSQASITPMIS